MTEPCLYYIHDPMCSWCYAFGQSWLALQQHLPKQVAVTCLTGGLAPDTMAPMPLETQKMVQDAWARIEHTVPGIRFNWEFWSCNTPIRSTYPACRAVLAAKKQRDAAEEQMILAIQNAYYQQAKNPSLTETLLGCARAIGLDEKVFSEDLASTETEQQLQRTIAFVRQMNVNSYPSLRLDYQGKLFSIGVDYWHYRNMLNAIMRILP